jgi:aminoglycoside 6'-N-acetyltransferase
VIPTLYGASVTLRPVLQEDLPRLAEILATPEVARWWGAYDEGRIAKEFLEPTPDTTVFVIEAEGTVVGSIQFYEEQSPDYRHAGIDVFLDPAFHHRGLGADAVRTVARHLVHDRAHHRLVIDPAADNQQAIRTYERVGFRRVGVMRQYERGPDGVWHDGLMMEALKADIL